MANITTCTRCSKTYEAVSEEDANSPNRLCRTCYLAEEQHKLCQEIGFPMFAPLNGICWSCGKDATHIGWTQEPQTGCRHCARSWCE